MFVIDSNFGCIGSSIRIVRHQYFAYHQSMNAALDTDAAASRIAAAIGEPARARMLYCLMDGHARTSTELATVAEVSPSTASVHLHRLKTERLVKVFVQGKHRYYSLEGADVANLLEGLIVLAGGTRDNFKPHTPGRLRAARTCYDHIAGTVGVSLLDRFKTLGWIASHSMDNDNLTDLTPQGTKGFEALGIDLLAARAGRRRFAYECLDWSERRPHIGGALGAALLKMTLKKRWLERELDGRALNITNVGRREMLARFGLQIEAR
jgi:DNA-binding transcriptional ArsR family regulator